MSFKYALLSFLAFCVCFFTSLKNYELWTHPLDSGPEIVAEKKAEEKPKALQAMEPQKDPNSARSYILIAEKNIFSPERKDFPIAVPVEQSKTNVRPQVVLCGVTIAEDYQAASVTNPGRTLRKGERETLTLKMGEKIGEYKLAKVSPDRILLENNGDSFEVLLYDPKAPKKRMEVRAESKPAAITSSQPTPAPSQGEAPKTIPAQQTAEAPKEPVQQSVVPPSPRPVSARPSFPQSLRGGRSPVYPRGSYPPVAGASAGATTQEPAGN